MEKFISLFGLFFFLGLAWTLSTDRKKISWRVVAGGLFLQFTFAILTLKTAPGLAFFSAVGDFFTALLGYVNSGSAFVFGPKFADFYFAFKVLPTIIFFSAFMSVLYYLGVMQRIVDVMARVMQVTLKTSGAESLSAASNIFLGQTEAPLVIKPYLAKMTLSEINCVMVGGFATVAGGVLAAYVGMGIDAGHLVTASVISAPAALLISKMMVPETQKPVTMGRTKIGREKNASNLIEAAAIDTSDGLHLALNVGAMLIAFMALIALVDGTIGWLGHFLNQEWSLSAVLGYAFAPFAYLMGIEWPDCRNIGHLLGLKMVANEFVAYQELATWAKPESAVQISERSKVLVTYALCGFANFSSIGIQIGGIGALVPERRSDLAKLGLRAMIGGTIACQMTACIASLLL